MVSIKHKKSFFLIQMQKFYCFVKSKFELAPYFSLLFDKNNYPIVSKFGKASIINKSLKKLFKKFMISKTRFQTVNKNCLEIEIFFISNY